MAIGLVDAIAGIAELGLADGRMRSTRRSVVLRVAGDRRGSIRILELGLLRLLRNAMWQAAEA